MLIDAQIRSLQNFADKFNLTVKYFQHEDMRRKHKFQLMKGYLSIHSPMTYDETNTFLCGVLNAEKINNHANS